MMRLELSDVETLELRELLREAVDDLHTEAFHTDKRELKVALRTRRERMLRLLHQIDQQIEADRAEAWV